MLRSMTAFLYKDFHLSVELYEVQVTRVHGMRRTSKNERFKALCCETILRIYK